ncbi:hypothetical protein F4860DRAFT_514056 [Xylaria cubensis]|nr:hypothetical protein F4860DRAFT_514056 [Xylaria cubensis]
MSPNPKRRGFTKPKGSKRTNGAWHAGIENFISRLQSQEIVKREPSKRLSSTKSNTEGILPNLPPQYTLAFPMSGYYMHPTFPQTTGSHTFEKAVIEDCNMVTVGNSSSDGGNNNPTSTSSIVPNLSGHTFNDLQISGSRGVHLGNTGTGSEGHKFTRSRVKRCVAPVAGDFSTMEVKYAFFRMH